MLALEQYSFTAESREKKGKKEEWKKTDVPTYLPDSLWDSFIQKFRGEAFKDFSQQPLQLHLYNKLSVIRSLGLFFSKS